MSVVLTQDKYPLRGVEVWTEQMHQWWCRCHCHPVDLLQWHYAWSQSSKSRASALCMTPRPGHMDAPTCRRVTHSGSTPTSDQQWQLYLQYNVMISSTWESVALKVPQGATSYSLHYYRCGMVLIHSFIHWFINKKLSYRKETVRLLHSIEIRVLH